MDNINESDWKYLSELRKTLLERLCNRILDNIETECKGKKRKPDVHEQYRKIYNLIKKWDETVADCFNDWNRSDIFFNILFLIKYQVITNKEINKLSDDTKERIKVYSNR
jgi:hypothetical protein